ncbi:MAG: hypothetical protein AAGA99_08950 [Actinomycetota bacterium]
MSDTPTAAAEGDTVDLVVTETHLHGRTKYHAGYTFPVDPGHFALAIEAGWGHAPGDEPPVLDRNRVVDIDVHDIVGTLDVDAPGVVGDRAARNREA